MTAERPKLAGGGRLLVQMVFEITGRGAVVAGDILGGVLRPGMLVELMGPNDESLRLTVSAVEFVDKVSERVSHIALIFEEKPPVDRVRDLVSVGAELVVGFDRAALVILVQRIMDAEGTEAEHDALILELQGIVADPGVTDLIYFNDLTAEEVVDKALAYQPIAL